MHSHAVELFATFETVKMSLFEGSYKNFDKVLIIFSLIPYLLKLIS